MIFNEANKDESQVSKNTKELKKRVIKLKDDTKDNFDKNVKDLAVNANLLSSAISLSRVIRIRFRLLLQLVIAIMLHLFLYSISLGLLKASILKPVSLSQE